MYKAVVFLSAALILFGCGSSGSSNDLEYTDRPEKRKEEFVGDADFYAANAQDYYDTGDYVRALVQFEKQLEIEPNSVTGRLGRAYSTFQVGLDLAARGRLADAEARFKVCEKEFSDLWDGKLASDTTSGSGFNWKACLGLAKTERAIAAVEKRQIDLIDARIGRVEDAKRVREMLADQRKRRERRLHYNRKALDKFERLTRMKNAAPDALLNLADLHLVLRNDTLAERTYLSYLEVAKKSVETWNQRRLDAPAQYKSKNELRAALEVIDAKLASATDKTVGVLRRLAKIKFEKRNYADCIGYLKDALDLAPDRYQLNVPLAESYERLQNNEKALEHIDEFIRSSPGFDKDVQKAYALRSRLLQKLEGGKVDGR